MYEHRSDPRIEEHADVYVKVQSAPEVRGLEGKVFPFHSENVSLYGLRLDVDIPVPIGALLELEIKLHNSAMKYRHLGNVVWIDAVDDEDLEQGHWHDMGIRLQAQANAQFDSWSAAVSNL
jgi:PilZ domain